MGFASLWTRLAPSLIVVVGTQNENRVVSLGVKVLRAANRERDVVGVSCADRESFLEFDFMNGRGSEEKVPTRRWRLRGTLIAFRLRS